MDIPEVVEDQRLLVMVQVGDLDGLGGLFDRYGSRCLVTAGRLLGDVGAAEDAVFNVFLDVWRRPPSQVAGSLPGFLLQSVYAQADGHLTGGGGDVSD